MSHLGDDVSVVALGENLGFVASLAADTDTRDVQLAVRRRTGLEDVERRYADGLRGQGVLDKSATLNRPHNLSPIVLLNSKNPVL